MATELGMLSQSLQKLAQEKHQQQQQQQRHQLNTWNYTGRRPSAGDGDSWEVRAFAEDMSSAMGTTWPPRSYTCTFCQREFRSAQALGGHMNVHRRDRARLQQFPQGPNPSPSPVAAAPSSPVVFPSPEFIASGGLCLFYPVPQTGVPLLDKVGMMGDINMEENGCVSSDADHGVVAEEMDLELRLGW